MAHVAHSPMSPMSLQCWRMGPPRVTHGCYEAMVQGFLWGMGLTWVISCLQRTVPWATRDVYAMVLP